MKAIILNEPGGVEQLHITGVERPSIGEAEVLIQTAAISINPVDCKTRAGKAQWAALKEQQPVILGWDVSGTVIESSTSDFAVGDEVFGMLNFPGHGKGYAEFVAAPADQLSLKPPQVSHQHAAASTLAALTALQVLRLAKVAKDQRVLIHAASGGVGHFAVQMTKLLGAYVIGTSSEANKDFVLSLGADEHVDYKAVRFEDAVKDIDVVVDTFGGDYPVRSLDVIKPGGKMVSIVIRMTDELQGQASAKGVEALFNMVQSNGADMKYIAGLLAEDKLRPYISHVFPFGEMAQAHEQQESGRTVGKIVLTMD